MTETRCRVCWRYLLCAAVGVTLLGCGDGRPARVPVSGQVLIDNAPLKYGFVRFVPEVPSRVSTGRLDNNGRFALSCYGQQDGAIVGKHRVEVYATEEVDEEHLRWHAPKKYSNWSTSAIVQEVDGPTDAITIQLSWGGGRPFIE